LGGEGEVPNSEPQEQTPSQKELAKLMQEYPHLKSHLKLFGNTIKSINQTLIYQPKYLQDTLVEQAYKLK
jgi:hypothetical protein